MSNSLDLLRMLEPVVRPGAPGASHGHAAGRLPIEQRSFDALLQEVQMDTAPAPGLTQTHELSAEPGGIAGGAGKPEINLLSPLSDHDAIGNASLRDLLAHHHRPGDNAG